MINSVNSNAGTAQQTSDCGYAAPDTLPCVIVSGEWYFWNENEGWVISYNEASRYERNHNDIPPHGTLIELKGKPTFHVCLNTSPSDEEDFFFKERYLIQNSQGEFWASQDGWVGHPKLATAFESADTELPRNGEWLDLWDNYDIRYSRYSEQLNSQKKFYIESPDLYVIRNNEGEFWTDSYNWTSQIEKAALYDSQTPLPLESGATFMDLSEKADLRWELLEKKQLNTSHKELEVFERGVAIFVKFYDANGVLTIPRKFYRTYPKLTAFDTYPHLYLQALPSFLGNDQDPKYELHQVPSDQAVA